MFSSASSLRVRRSRTCATAAVIALALSACANIGTAQSSGEASSCRAVAATTQPQPPQLPDKTAGDLPNPRTLTGSTTAYTRQAHITPISDTPTDSQQLPVTVHSSDGVDQTVTDTTRILALNQNGGIAAAVIGLGFGCNLVGRDTSTSYPGYENLPKVTQNGHELNAEAILALKPTLILTDTSIGPYDVQMQLREAGIPVVFLPVSSTAGIGGVSAEIRSVARALGVEKLGDQLATRTMKEINLTVEKISHMAPENYADRPRAVFLYVRGKSVYYWFGQGSGADSLISAISAADVASEVGFTGMTPTNAEALVQAAPDVIITMTLGVASTGGIDEVLSLPGIQETPAGKNRRIIDMSDYEVMSFGPRTAEVLAALATAIYDPDEAYQPETPPEAIAQRLHEITEKTRQ